MTISKLVRIAMVAAVYLVLTLIFSPISFNIIQVRISESLTVLPYIFPYATYGLPIGVLLANIFGPVGLIDMVFGTLATLIAAVLTRKMPTSKLAPLPPVLVNAVIVGGYLSVILSWHILIGMVSVAIGQFLACYLIGYPLLLGLQRLPDKYYELLSEE